MMPLSAEPTSQSSNLLMPETDYFEHKPHISSVFASSLLQVMKSSKGSEALDGKITRGAATEKRPRGSLAAQDVGDAMRSGRERCLRVADAHITRVSTIGV